MGEDFVEIRCLKIELEKIGHHLHICHQDPVVFLRIFHMIACMQYQKTAHLFFDKVSYYYCLCPRSKSLYYDCGCVNCQVGGSILQPSLH